MRGRHDWLDAVAVRLAGGSSTPTHVLETPTVEDSISRARLIKLAVAGAASLSWGLWTAPSAARAQGQEGCFTWCFNEVGKLLSQRLAACEYVFRPFTFYENGAWRKAAIAGLFGSATQVALAARNLQGLCNARARFESEENKKDCYGECEKRCPKRALQSRSLPAQVCEPPLPPNQTPKLPPAPSKTEDPCWSCVEVGGQCCGPFTGDPATGQFTPCACATPGVGCEAYGCG